MSVTHKWYGSALSIPRASQTGNDPREVCGSIKTLSGDIEIVDTTSDGKTRRRKGAVGMTLRQGDTICAGENSATSVAIAGSKRMLHVMSNSACFFL